MRSYTKPFTTYIIAQLENLYPDAHCELNYTNPLELVIATVLSAQCTDVQVNKVTTHLFQKYKIPTDYLAVEQSEIEHDIRSIGFFRSKAGYIQSLCTTILQDFDGEVPDTMEGLLTLKGVARKTANVVLWNAFRKNEGVVVDTHVRRLSNRIGLSKHEDVKKIEKDLMKRVPKEMWGQTSHLLIFHGRRVCNARKPKCKICSLKSMCKNPIVDI